jgi:hypothetical protein
LIQNQIVKCTNLWIHLKFAKNIFPLITIFGTIFLRCQHKFFCKLIIFSFPLTQCLFELVCFQPKCWNVFISYPCISFLITNKSQYHSTTKRGIYISCYLKANNNGATKPCVDRATIWIQYFFLISPLDSCFVKMNCLPKLLSTLPILHILLVKGDREGRTSGVLQITQQHILGFAINLYNNILVIKEICD